MTDYVKYVVDQLANFGAVTAKTLFGGFGIYKEGTIVGIIVENELYFKTDKDSEKEYYSYGSEPFSYRKDDKVIKMSYWKVPEQILEHPEKLCEFAFRAYSISVNTKKQLRKRK